MTTKPLLRLAALLAAVSIAACGASPRASHAGARPATPPVSTATALAKETGCLQGVVMDGVTGERIDLGAPTPTNGVNVLVGGNLVPGKAIVDSPTAAKEPNLKGEYLLCDIPLESDFPVFAWLPGYQPFESQISVPASAPASSGKAFGDRFSELPTLQANIRLFPVAPATQPFVITVTNDGLPLAGAAITVTPTGQTALAQGDGFLAPVPVSQKTLNATTDANGEISLPADQISLGGIYRYHALPPAGGTDDQARTGTFVVGYLSTPGDPYHQFLDLALVPADLRVVSSSLENRTFSEDGSVHFLFDRPIELVPGSAKQITATLHFSKTAALVDDVPANDVPEQAVVTIDGSKLTLSPVFKTAPDRAKEPGLTVTYNGVNVRPATGRKLIKAFDVAATVSFFGGVAAAPAATALAVLSGNAQQASSGARLPQALVVVVTDQYGAPFPGASVTFAATAGGGSLIPATATSDAQGRAQAVWTLGTTGTQTATATAGALPPVTFTATFLGASGLQLVSGDAQSAAVGLPLANPLVVKLTDTNGVPVAGAPVTFTVNQAAGGTVDAVAGSAPASSVQIVTDATGLAKAVWKMGTVGADYTVTASATGVTAATFHATAQQPTNPIAKSPDGTARAAGSTATVFAGVVDQKGNPIAGVAIKFVVTTTAATLQIGAGAPAQTVTGISDTLGRVSVVWKLGTAPAATVQALTISVTGLTDVVINTPTM